MTHGDEQSLEERLVRYLSGDVTEEERLRLDEEVARNPAAAKRLRELADREVMLLEALGSRYDRSPVAAASPRRRLPRRLIAAAALLLVALLGWLLVPSGPRSPRFEQGALFGVTATGDLVPLEGLDSAATYFARSGRLVLEGVTVDILAPTVFRLSEAGVDGAGDGVRAAEVVLDAGRARVEVSPRGKGFQVQTPRGRFTDLGTRFEVQLTEELEEAQMLTKVRAGSLPIFVLATVLSGHVLWQPVDGEERVLGPETGPLKLADDFSAGRVTDREGLVFVRPATAERWTLACVDTPLERGDWVRAAARGANAAEIALPDGSRITLGPGALVELAEKRALTVSSGEVEIRPAAGTSVRAAGPGGASVLADTSRVVRASEDGLAVLEEEPRWLTGFKAKASTEALGSLLADIDGRNEPLTIGYHKVAVDIRDQIARTTIEESFVNHTDAVLEGVFYFPLPQEASISGFGMWIGGELVEADIVEKQRAREIYEEILREKRDPGLLEWTGGSIFKARVYPIPAQGEKRIRIVYTQVLPKSASAYRYSYALRSEMLEKHPLGKLEIAVVVSSREALASVQCPSHPARIQKTKHSARVEFSAEEYTPRRDLEVVLETEPSGAGGPSGGNVIVVPHRRGEDGYLMVLLSAEGSRERRLVRDGPPLDLVVVADTSGSLTQAQVDEQRLFIRSLLEGLGKEDRFNLVAFDADVARAFPSRSPVTPENRDAAMAFLKKRGYLGWTDFDRVFGEVMAAIQPETHVVYVGDGVPSLRDADPAGLGGRIKRLWKGAGSFHAVGLGSTYDLTVLRAIASLGGSLHRTGGGRDAALVASELLEEITSPGLRDVRLEWEGIRVAAVHPESLPNLPSGRQQVVLARYLPEDGDLRGSLRASGTLAGKPWSAEAPITLAATEEGNSFIPRFWARRHLDRLLEEGQTPEVRERIIALSEDYQIITPYTSLLVLESDEDRRRFGVEKRLRMRDAEEFFAEGREDARYELVRQQMLRAKLWRQRLRQQFLLLYAGMGRDLSRGRRRANGVAGRNQWAYFRGLGELDSERRLFASSRAFAGDEWFAPSDETRSISREYETLAMSEVAYAPDLALEDAGIEVLLSDDFDSDDPLSVAAPVAVSAASEVPALGKLFRYGQSFGRTRGTVGLDLADMSGLVPTLGSVGFDGRAVRSRPSPPFTGVFPVPGSPQKELSPRWPAAVRDTVEELDRRSAIASLSGGLRIVFERDSTDHRGRVRPAARAAYVLSPVAWASRTAAFPGDIPITEWVRDGKRGALDGGRLLAGEREAQPADASSWPAPFAGYFDDLERTYSQWSVDARSENGRVVLTLGSPVDTDVQVRITADTDRRAVLEVVTLRKDEVTSTVTFGDFSEIAGAAWPQRIEWKDEEGRTTSVARVRYEALDAAGVAQAMDRALAPLAESIVLERPLPDLAVAKRRAAAGDASFADRWVLMRHFGAFQEWELVREHLDRARPLVEGKPGLDWIRLELLLASRRNEEARALGSEIASRIAEKPTTGEYSLAEALRNRLWGPLGASENLGLLESLRPVAVRQDKRLQREKGWSRARLDLLRQLGRGEEERALLEELGREYPYDVDLQIRRANDLTGRGEVDRAVAHLDTVRKEHGPWLKSEEYRLRSHASETLRGARRLVDFLAYVDRWVEESPGTVEASTLDRYLSALVMLDREAEADARMEKWLSDACVEEPADLQMARLYAAVRHALNHGDDLYSSRAIEPRWRAPLVAVVRHFVFREDGARHVGQIVGQGRFRELPEARALRRDLFQELVRRIDDLEPKVLHNACQWVRRMGYSPAEGEPSWDDVARKILARWEDEPHRGARALLEAAILWAGSRDVDADLRRRQLARAETPEERSTAAGQLLELLLSKDWTREVEEEVFRVLRDVGHGPDKHATQVGWIPRVLEAAGRSLISKRIEAIPDRSTKSRRELQPLEAKARKEASADLLEVARRLEEAGLGDAITPFVRIERLSVAASLQREAEEVFAALRSLLLEIPPPPPVDDEDPDPLEPARDLLAERALLAMAYLATVPDAPAERPAVLLELLDALISKNIERAKAAGVAEGEARHARLERPLAKAHKYRLLVVLDRGDELEELLRAWARDVGGVPANPWKVPLAYILAERGKLREAVDVFRSVEKVDELGAAEYGALAGWLMALDEREERREARIQVYVKMNEWNIRNQLQSDVRRYQRRGDEVPEEIDEEVFLRFAALMRKGSSPGNYLWILREYYKATKDFRLLETLPEGVLGQTAGRIYAFLGSLGDLMALIGDEATIDRLLAHLRALRGGELTPVDRRALQLLEFLVERQAAAQAHGAGPHVDAALEAFQKAYAAELVEGEAVPAARFLAGVGKVVPKLREVVLERLRQLHDGAELSTEERFHVGWNRARSLRANEQTVAGIQLLDAVLEEYRTARGGVLPSNADGALEELAGWYEAAGEHLKAERIWRRELDIARNEARRRWVEVRLLRSLQHALDAKGRTSLGSGTELYDALRAEILGSLERRTDEGHASELVNVMCATLNVGRDKYDRPKSDVVRFGYEDLPRVLRMYQYRNGQQMVRAVAHALKGKNDWRAMVEFFVVRAESEPGWLERGGNDFWPAHGHRLAEARSHVRNLGGIETRVLQLFLDELGRDLRTRDQRARSGYHARNAYFWKEKREAFLETAKEALAEVRQLEGHAIEVAQYLRWGLKDAGAAVDALYPLYRAGTLGRNGRYHLVQYLFVVTRYEEAVPILEGLVEDAPFDARYRADLMRANNGCGNRTKLAETLAAAEEQFHDKGRTESAVAHLAEACRDTRLLEDAARLYGEAITLHTRNAPNRGVGGDTLSGYYGHQAEVYADLGDTAKAVDAAAGAIVSWGKRQDKRAAAEQALLDVVEKARDLDGYVEGFEADLAKKGLENPIVRKAIGKVYLKRKAYDKAARQLAVALESGPSDMDTCRAYLGALDQSGKPEVATAELWRIARLRGHDLALFKELGERYEKARDGAMADRAYTSLAELSANESEGRQLLAEVRDAERRFLEAAEEWRQVIRIRTKEPTGYIGLARALIEAGEIEAAREPLRALSTTTWHPRFGDVEKTIRGLEEKIEGR